MIGDMQVPVMSRKWATSVEYVYMPATLIGAHGTYIPLRPYVFGVVFPHGRCALGETNVMGVGLKGYHCRYISLSGGPPPGPQGENHG